MTCDMKTGSAAPQVPPGEPAATATAASAAALHQLQQLHLQAQALDKLGYRFLNNGTGGGASSPGESAGVEPVQPNAAFDIASLVLYGCQALPIRLKILLDRLFSVLHRDEVLQVLSGFGWTTEDYARGYILQEGQSGWNICSQEEEPLVLQQFLRFGETRAITQQLLAAQARAHESTTNLPPRSTAPGPPPPPPPPAQVPPPQTPAATAAAVAAAAAAAVAAAGSGTTGPPSQMAQPPQAPQPPSCPLSRLQSMQPFDFRKNSPRSPPANPMNLTSPRMPVSHPPIKSPGPSSGSDLDDDDDEDDSHSALNLSLAAGKPQHAPRGPRPGMPRKSTSASSGGPTKRHWGGDFPPNLGTQLVNPTTGKKRVQCNVCLKTFCDKGALKIHFSAVHLREMHKCTVQGCNMMFSSRRSRNRHSANPNPKLHSPHLRRKISPHDGRSAQAHPILPPGAALSALSSIGPLGFGAFPLLSAPQPGPPSAAAAAAAAAAAVVGHPGHSSGHLPPPSLLPRRPEGSNTASSDASYDEMDDDGIVVELDDAPQPTQMQPLSLTQVYGSLRPKRAKLSESDDAEGESNPDLEAEAERHRETTLVDRDLDLERERDRRERETEREQDPDSDSASKERETGEPPSKPLEEVSQCGKAVRKRKSQNPTRCPAAASLSHMTAIAAALPSDDEEAQFDHRIKREEEEREKEMNLKKEYNEERIREKELKEEKEKEIERERALEKGREREREIERERELVREKEQERQENDEKTCEREKDISIDSERPEDREERDREEEDRREKCSTASQQSEGESVDSSHALRHLESLSQGHFLLDPPSPGGRSSSGGGGESPGADSADDSQGYGDGTGFLDVPLDRENPRRCTACGKVFQNHFGVKTHFQNVHLKLMHKCTVDGCNAAFPSKRSRDRHSANLNLHRKLLSTSAGLEPPFPLHLHPDFLARIYNDLPLALPPPPPPPPELFNGERLPAPHPSMLLNPALGLGFPGMAPLGGLPLVNGLGKPGVGKGPTPSPPGSAPSSHSPASPAHAEPPS